MICQYGCFRKWWYPQIIHFNRVFHYKSYILGYSYFWKHPYHPTLHGFFLAANFGRFALRELSQRYFGCLIPSQGHELIVDLSWLVVFSHPSEEYYRVKMGSSSPNRGRFIKKIFELPPPSQIFWLKQICANAKNLQKGPKLWVYTSFEYIQLKTTSGVHHWG